MIARTKPVAAVQARLPLERSPDFERESFIISQGNAAAFAAIEAWPRWPGGRLVLVGPAHAGKSHLAAIWAKRTRAEVLRPGDALLPHRGSAVVLEDADQRIADEGLFHLLNVADPEAFVLMTARTAPRQWTAHLPDLRSRLNALWVVELAIPDEVVLAGLLAKFFRERNIRPEPDVIPYLLRRIERSAAAAFDIVSRIDEAADAERREVTRVFAGDILDRAEAALDLFD